MIQFQAPNFFVVLRPSDVMENPWGESRFWMVFHIEIRADFQVLPFAFKVCFWMFVFSTTHQLCTDQVVIFL